MGDLVEEDSAVGLEGLPLQAGAEDDQRRHRPVLVEAQVLCRSKQMLSLLIQMLAISFINAACELVLQALEIAHVGEAGQA